jgi:hypothetical protein
LASKVVEPPEFIPLGSETMRGDDGNSGAYESAAEERDGNGNPINSGGGFWHQVAFVLKI